MVSSIKWCERTRECVRAVTFDGESEPPRMPAKRCVPITNERAAGPFITGTAAKDGCMLNAPAAVPLAQSIAPLKAAFIERSKSCWLAIHRKAAERKALIAATPLAETRWLTSEPMALDRPETAPPCPKRAAALNSTRSQPA